MGPVGTGDWGLGLGLDNWSVTKYMQRGINSEVYKVYLKRTKDLNDVQAVDYDLSSLDLNN